MGPALFGLYAALLLALGLHDGLARSARAGRSGRAGRAGAETPPCSAADEYYVNGRRSGTAQVALSLVASCVGGSATVGMAGLAWQIGLPAVWWLASGACGLLLLVRFMARKVRESGARTMPELVGVSLGPASRPLVSLIILVAWTAILAAQFTAAGGIVAALAGLSPKLALPAGAALITLYALLGGQASVIRSDVIQYLLLAAGFGAVLIFLLVAHPEPFAAMSWALLSPEFPPSSLVRYLLILGGGYVVCPMLFGRLLSARDTRSAVRGGSWAVPGLVLTALLVVLVGIGCRGLVPPGTPPDQVLPAALGALPPWLGPVLLLALLSAVLSSADSCLLTAATVCCNDVLRRESVGLCRAAALGLGLAAYVLGSHGQGVLALLFMANDIYVCGVVVPVFLGILGGRGSVAPGWACGAVLAGGLAGLTSAVTGNEAWSCFGLAVSALLSVVGMARRAFTTSFSR